MSLPSGHSGQDDGDHYNCDGPRRTLRQFMVPDCGAIAMWGIDSAVRSMPKNNDGAPSPRSRDPFLEAHRVPSTWNGCLAALGVPADTAKPTVGSKPTQGEESIDAQEQLYDCRGLIQVNCAWLCCFIDLFSVFFRLISQKHHVCLLLLGHGVSQAY